MSLSPQDVIRASIRRYQLDMLFVYYDQLEKKEDFLETFGMHMHILIDSIKKIASIRHAEQWIDKIAHRGLSPLESKEIIKVKQHMQSIFDEDFLDLFDDISVEELSTFTNVIHHLDIPVVKNNDILPQSVNSYIEQFLPNNTQTSTQEIDKA